MQAHGLTSPPFLHIRASEASIRPPVTVEALFLAITNNNYAQLEQWLKHYEVNLTLTNPNSHNQTPLHLAVSRGHYEVSQQIANHAKNNPIILDALDSKGRNPLLIATKNMDVPMMCILIEAGATVNNLHNPWHNSNYHESFNVKLNAWKTECRLASAQMLIAARGNITTAFESAVTEKDYISAKMYFTAGADSRPMIQQCLQNNQWNTLEWIVTRRFISLHDLASLIDQAVQNHHQQATEALINWDRNKAADSLLVQYALEYDQNRIDTLLKSRLRPDFSLVKIAETKNKSEDEKLRAMTMVTHSEFFVLLNAETTLHRELKLGHLATVSLMIRAGIPCLNTLISRTVQQDRKSIEKLISFGANPISILRTPQVLGFIKHAPTLAQYALKICIIDSPHHNNESKISTIKEWLSWGAHMKAGAESLLIDEWKKKCYTQAKYLIDAHTSSHALLIELGRTHDLSGAIRAINWNGDISCAINTLTANNRRYHLQNNEVAARKEQDAANLLVLALASINTNVTLIKE